MRGRKPTPTALKLVEGVRKSRLNKDEPNPSLRKPRRPPFLSKYARQEWARMSRLLFHLGLLTQIDSSALAAYCTSFGRWRKAEEDLAESGLLLKNTSGNVIANPLVGIANKAQADMMKILVEFGMTPSSRSRVTVAEKAGRSLEDLLRGPAEDDPLEELLNTPRDEDRGND